MKKILSIIILTTLFISTYAQQTVKDQSPKSFGESSTIEAPNTNSQHLRRKLGYSGWYNHLNILDAICSDPANLTGYVGLMNYDSNLVIVAADGEQYHVYNHSIGTIVDPTDPDWKEMADPIPEDQIYNQHVKYTFDSLQFPYAYIRNLDSMKVNGTQEKIIDTLFVQYFLKNNLRNWRWGTIQEYGMGPDSLNVSTGLANNYTKIDTILLDETNSTEKTAQNTYRYANMRLGVNIKNDLPDGIVPKFRNGEYNDWSKSTVGFNILFKSMKPTVFGDTMTANDGSIVHNKHNFFGFSYTSDGNPRDAQVINTEHLNGSFKNTKALRHGGVQNGWKHYNLMRAYFEKQYQNSWVKLIAGTHDVSVKNMNANGYGVDQIYPNPTHGKAFLNISLKKANNVTLQVFNISGQIVLSNNIFATSGSSIINFNTKNLAKGIYLATIKVENNTFTRKFIVE